jgi:alkylhydroperoxidase family enzyme
VVLGRSAGLNEEQLVHIGDDPLPDDGTYDELERAIVEYAQRSSKLEPITDELFARLEAHLDRKQLIELCFTVGLSNLINRFHATFLTDVDAATCALPMPDELQQRADDGWTRSAGT